MEESKKHRKLENSTKQTLQIDQLVQLHNEEDDKLFLLDTSRCILLFILKLCAVLRGIQSQKYCISIRHLSFLSRQTLILLIRLLFLRVLRVL